MPAIPIGYAIAAFALAAGAATAGTILSGQAQAAAAKDAAKAALAEASVRNAESQHAARQIRRRNMLILGSQRAAAAKANLDIGAGSVADFIEDSAIQGELDALAALYSGKAAGGLLAARASSLRSQAKSYVTGSYIGAAGSIIGSAGSAIYISKSPGTTAGTGTPAGGATGGTRAGYS